MILWPDSQDAYWLLRSGRARLLQQKQATATMGQEQDSTFLWVASSSDVGTVHFWNSLFSTFGPPLTIDSRNHKNRTEVEGTLLCLVRMMANHWILLAELQLGNDLNLVVWLERRKEGSQERGGGRNGEGNARVNVKKPQGHVWGSVLTHWCFGHGLRKLIKEEETKPPWEQAHEWGPKGGRKAVCNPAKSVCCEKAWGCVPRVWTSRHLDGAVAGNKGDGLGGHEGNWLGRASGGGARRSWLV